MTAFGTKALSIDADATVERIQRWLVQTVSRQLHRKGVVLGVSGGVDSAVCLALACRALGARRVFPLLMPDLDTPAGATERAVRLCVQLGVGHASEPIGDVLTALGCYRRRDQAISAVFPDYRPGFPHKLTLMQGLLDRDVVPSFHLVVQFPDGEERMARLSSDAHRAILAATNMKQRIRKVIEYSEAERLNHAVLGTANRLEHKLGFFVRGGDGLADLMPIAHLYKTQVLAVAHHLGLPAEIIEIPPTTDTFSLAQTQEEFYFGLPLPHIDLLLYAHTHGVPVTEAGRAVGLRPEQVGRAYRDLESKRRAAARLSRAELTVDRNPLPGTAPERGRSPTGPDVIP